MSRIFRTFSGGQPLSRAARREPQPPTSCHAEPSRFRHGVRPKAPQANSDWVWHEPPSRHRICDRGHTTNTSRPHEHRVSHGHLHWSRRVAAFWKYSRRSARTKQLPHLQPSSRPHVPARSWWASGLKTFSTGATCHTAGNSRNRQPCRPPKATESPPDVTKDISYLTPIPHPR